MTYENLAILIPASLKNLALGTEGKSYDYDMNFLDEAMRVSECIMIPISSSTKSRNATSHFRPVVNLLGLYQRFWRYMFTSLTAIVFIGQMAVSGLAVTLLNVIPLPTVLIKALVDLVLFFVSYNLQKNWVFKTEA